MNARILVVDDDDDIREMMSILLSQCGYDVVTARGGEDALRVLSDGGVSVMLVDLMMPVMDGAELIERTRAGGHDIPVIVVSGDPAGAERARRARADVFLQKPVDLDQLLDVVAHLAGAGAEPV